jgi:hypothetical protein
MDDDKAEADPLTSPPGLGKRSGRMMLLTRVTVAATPPEHQDEP